MKLSLHIALATILLALPSIATAQEGDAASVSDVQEAFDYAGELIRRGERVARAQQALSATEIFFRAEDADSYFNSNVRFRGNRALLSPVLFRVLGLPADFEPDAEKAQAIELVVEEFYRETGYDLARVRAVFDGELITVYINEGVLQKVVFRGTSTTQAIDLRLRLKLPGNVYNRQYVANELRRLEEESGFETMRARLVERRPPREPKSGLRGLVPGIRAENESEILEGLGGEYELIVDCRSPRRSHGFGYGIEVLLPYGLEGRTTFSMRDALVDNDRLETRVKLAGDANQAFTRTSGELSYVLPPVAGDWLRPNLRLWTQLTDLSRPLLGIDDYLLLVSSVSARVGISPMDNVLISGGLGIRYDDAFEVVREFEVEGVDDTARAGIFGVLEAKVDFAPDVVRRDHAHELSFRVMHLSAFDEDSPFVLEGRYQNVFNIGYDDLLIRGRAHGLFNEPTWRDERGIGSSIMKVVASEESFAARNIQAGVEYRYSLYRDLLKLDGFVGLAAFDGLDYPGVDRDLTWATSFGPGISALVLDNIGVNVYYALGVGESKSLIGQLNISIQKVY